ncbi:MAG: hypothetical protein ACO4AV_12920 [bacterium]
MRLFILAVDDILHALFMVLELLPPKNVKLLQILSEKLSKEESFSNAHKLVAIIVLNAGIWNHRWLPLVVSVRRRSIRRSERTASAPCWRRCRGRVGTLSLESSLTAIQGVAGIAGAPLVATCGLGMNAQSHQ